MICTQESVKTCFLEEHSLHGRIVDVKPAWENKTRKPGHIPLKLSFPSHSHPPRLANQVIIAVCC